MSPIVAKEFSGLAKLEGLSVDLISDHQKLYQGYVTNANLLIDKLAELRESGQGVTPEFAEMSRRFGWEFNGVKLHELYFSNLVAGGRAPGQRIHELITANFGSFDSWISDFKNTGKMRGIGWVILYLDDETKLLHNQWINEHDVGHLAGARPLMVMDVFEHAYMKDYGINRADYIEAFFGNIDWETIEKRLP